jgi:hypothetical protein
MLHLVAFTSQIDINTLTRRPVHSAKRYLSEKTRYKCYLESDLKDLKASQTGLDL